MMSRPGAASARKYSAEVLAAGVPVAVSKARGLVLLPILLHFIGVAAYGAWIQVLGVAQLAAILAGLGLHNALISHWTKLATRQARLNLLLGAVLHTQVVAWLIALALVSASSVLAPWLFGSGDYTPAWSMGALLVPLLSLKVLVIAALRADDRIISASAVETAAGLAELGLCVLFAAVFRNAAAVMAGSVAGLLLANGLLLARLFQHRSGMTLRPAAIGALWRHALPVVPTQIADDLLARGDRLVVGAILGPAAAGQYAAVYAVSSLPTLLSGPVTSALYPKVARCWNQGHLAAAGRYVGGSSQVVGLVVLLSVAILAVAGDPLLRLLGLDAVHYLPTGLLIALGTGAFTVGRILATLMFAQGRTRQLSAVWILAAALNLLLNVQLVPRAGIAGAGLATAVSYLVFLVGITLYVRRDLRYLPVASWPRHIFAAARG